MNVSQPWRNRLAHRVLTAAMLGCFALAGWFWQQESSPKTHQAIAAVTTATQPSATSQLPSQRVGETRATSQEPACVRLPRYVTKNIEDIRVGDYVLAREEHGDKIALRKVVEVYRRMSYHLRHLTFESEDGSHQTLHTTDEHPFWSVSRNTWIDAGDFQLGEQVTSPTGQLQTITTTHRTEHPNGFPVFNFQVEGFHTYFVSMLNAQTPLLVHNADHVYRVMSEAEFSGASLGKWADSAAPEIPGVKHTWESLDDAKKWKDFLEANGETGSVIAKIDVFKDSSAFKSWLHSTPAGRVIEVPLSMLGVARRIP